MFITRFRFLIAIINLALIPVCLSEQNFRYKVWRNYKLKEVNVSMETRFRSRAECLTYCSLQQKCVSISFRLPTERLVSSHDTIYYSAKNPSIPTGLVLADGWTTMIRMIYPVFHSTGQYGRYSMNFWQAKQQCIEYGTTIATPSDLQQARSLGYQVCSCGWLSNGKNGYIMIVRKQGCSFSQTIIYCYRKTADVFCKFV